jgi:phosphoribosylformylglycinamidine cyclo-ligase
MVIVVPASHADKARDHLQAQGETVYRIGEIITRQGDGPQVELEHQKI